MNLNKLAFFYPSKVAGGAELLFARLGSYLCENFGTQVYFVDYKDGFIRNNPLFQKLNFIDYTDDEKSQIPDIEALITPISNINRLNKALNFENIDTKLLFWCIHPLNVLHIMPKGAKLQNYPMIFQKFFLKTFYNKKYRRMKNLLTEFTSMNACYFMDFENLNYQKMLFDIDLSKDYLPVCCPIPSEEANTGLISADEIHICILGRLVKEKVYPLIAVLDNLVNYDTKKKKIVHIIGDGDSKRLINTEKYKNKLDLRFVGTISDISTLHSYMLCHCDIIFAMGTSVIEASGLKIPAVLLPYSYRPIKINKFAYFYEAFDYVLGTNYNLYKEFAQRTFSEILDEIYVKGQKYQQGVMCHKYSVLNHTVESVSEKLIQKIQDNLLSYNAYRELILCKKTILY